MKIERSDTQIYECATRHLHFATRFLFMQMHKANHSTDLKARISFIVRPLAKSRYRLLENRLSYHMNHFTFLKKIEFVNFSKSFKYLFNYFRIKLKNYYALFRLTKVYIFLFSFIISSKIQLSW